ncbi:MAG: thymidylate synthase [Prolixibacteraceae bacterium]|nr:thymidylate synthase [Prolixibacteraceae bacterium]
MKNIPVIAVSGKSLAESFEKALVNLYEKGIRFKTQYDKPDDPESIDCTLNLTIEDPESEPMIHMAFPSGIEQLKEYVMELKGFKDHWVKNMNDTDDTRWEYTYHGRLEKYGIWLEKVEGERIERGPFKINQIEAVIEKLCKQPFTRQAQMITWMPNLDLECFDPPCLQSLWYRILEDEEGVWWLNCNIRFRSNDAWGASFMNMFGFIQFNKEVIAAEISKRTGKEVKLGRLNWQADSYHIYGRDIQQAKEMLFDRLEGMSLEERTYNFSDDFIKDMYDSAEPGILEKIKQYDEEHS